MSAQPRRFVLCTTPAHGHTAPLVAVAGRLVADGHEVVFFTTEHYRARIEGTGARFVPFAAEDDAHDLMVANPERESSSKRGVRGVKDDLRRIFIGPLPGQCRGLRAILDGFAADCIVVDSMFFGALPLALGPRAARPALACVGVMPYSSNSRDTAPFGVAFQPGTGPLHRAAQRGNELGDRARRADRHAALRPAPAGRGRSDRRIPRLLRRPPAQGGRCLPAGDGGRLRIPAVRPRVLGALRRADPRPAGAGRRAAGVVGRARGRPARSCTSPRARSTTPTSAGSCW